MKMLSDEPGVLPPNGRLPPAAAPRVVPCAAMPALTALGAYPGRIGLAGHPDPGLAELHRAHATTIPFEGLDPYAGGRSRSTSATSRRRW